MISWTCNANLEIVTVQILQVKFKLHVGILYQNLKERRVMCIFWTKWATQSYIPGQSYVGHRVPDPLRCWFEGIGHVRLKNLVYASFVHRD